MSSDSSAPSDPRQRVTPGPDNGERQAAVQVLASAPAVLDLFMWLSYRCFVAKGPEAIPIFGPAGLVRQIGSVEYSRERRFISKLEQWLTSFE